MKIFLCGIGNSERGDDGFGPYIIARVNASKTIEKLDCGLHLENYLNKIVEAKPDVIIILDAIKKPGKRGFIFKDEEILEHNPISVSTHNLPFSSVYQFLKENTKAEILLVAAVAQSFDEFSASVKQIADRIADTLNSIDKRKNLGRMLFHENLLAAIRQDI